MAIITIEKLENADKDADSLDDFVSGNGKKKVKTRRGAEYLTAPGVEQTLLDNGLKRGFANKAALDKYKPSIEGSLAQDMETKKVWLWDGAKWNDTGASDKDLANQYTDEKSLQLNKKISDIQTFDFHTQVSANQDSWQGLDAIGNVLIAVDAEGNFQQNYHYDFHIKPESPSFQIVDRNLNLIFGNSDLYLRDFFTKKNEIAFITVDQNLNILNSNNQQDTDLDFSELNYSALNPNALKNKEPYLNYSKLCVQQDFTDDLYIKDSFEIFKKHTDVYDFYDVLKAQHPDRVSSEVLGYDGLNNEIRQYSYTPKLFEDDGTNGWTSAEMQPIKLVVTTGVHGIERDSVLQFAVLFNEILNRSNEIEEASFLSQFRIVIVPMICPNGYDANTRNNHNGVNINRNAPAGWSKWANGEAGQKPLDQPETQVACSLPQLHSDASVFVDFHNYNAGIYRSGWYGTSKLETLNVVKRIAMKIQASIQKDFNYLKKNPIRIAKNTGGTTCLDWQETSKKKGYLFETPLFGGTRPLYENRQYGLFVIRTALTEIMKHEIGA
ncbi:hypothetical protein B9T31_06125 [Acinetobacter sp. ANC 4558]|uniref:M14 family metallopeptidase n=1 Tax=Acinetobacter sp. ANC 4558 TaxID=1977876 RepID=UPI000A32BA8A|nr:M14 family metallopeptidase [Acinetobacter sp. ANC 4558]OTG87182.1 hypothetical protein B9T31_06125 [Acinetobacter sp. ANC 4558]